VQEAVRLPHTAKVVVVGRGAAEPWDVVDRASFDSMTNTNAHAAIPSPHTPLRALAAAGSTRKPKPTEYAKQREAEAIAEQRLLQSTATRSHLRHPSQLPLVLGAAHAEMKQDRVSRPCNQAGQLTSPTR
jgi:hypothetical protein